MDNTIKITLTPSIKKYYNKDTYYGIYICNTQDEVSHYNKKYPSLGGGSNYLITIVGSMQELDEGVSYEFEGVYEFNQRYNQHQYKAINVKPIKPVTLKEQKKFLKCIISERQADTLLGVYPNIVEMVLKGEEVDLSLTKGIKDKVFNNIKEKILANFGDMELINLLKPYSITDGMLNKLKQKHPNTEVLKDMVFNNPYVLTDIKGFGFKKVDGLALSINPDIRDSKFRASAYIKHTLTEIANGVGNTRIHLEELDKLVEKDIPDCLSSYNEVIDYIETQGTSPNSKCKFIILNGYIGLREYFKKEFDIIKKLNELNESKSLIDTSKIDIDLVWKTFYKNRGYHLTDEQKEIVTKAIENNVVTLTGNAGSGKSSCIYAIHLAFKQLEDVSIGQCALSAKAALRIKETTGSESSTIHRLLGASKEGFTYNENSNLPQNLIILDEASMVNVSIFHSLVTAIANGSKFIIVFDDAQLPPIGAGNVATDLLSSHLAIIKLTKVHRQAEASGILSDANTIRKGINPIPKPEQTLVRGDLKDQFYMFRDDTQEMFDLGIKYYMKTLETQDVDDVVICVPRKENAKISTLAFNNKIQEMLLGDEKEFIQYGDKVFKLGAKVIQRENNPAIGIYNGDIGYVTGVDLSNNTYTVKFHEKYVTLNKVDMANMELAYALTCHLLQGSQYHTVITLLANDSFVLLSKEMAYTAVTRAEKRGLVIAQPKAFNYACKKSASKRKTWMQQLL